jgi:hypothetical protein
MILMAAGVFLAFRMRPERKFDLAPEAPRDDVLLHGAATTPSP